MIKKSIKLLKENPVLILFYLIYMAIAFTILFLLYPHHINQRISTSNLDLVAYAITMIKMLIALGLIAALGIVFISGFGNMLREAVINGTTSKSSFFPGVKRFFVRSLLAAFLYFGFAIVLGIVMSIITIPITITQVLNGHESIEFMSIIITVITMTITTFSLPFLMLWIPSIFVDDTGIFQALKNGVRMGVKNYWKLVLALVIIYLPSGILMLFNYPVVMNGEIFAPAMLVMYLLSAIISIVFILFLFVLYWEKRQKELNY